MDLLIALADLIGGRQVGLIGSVGGGNNGCRRVPTAILTLVSAGIRIRIGGVTDG